MKLSIFLSIILLLAEGALTLDPVASAPTETRYFNNATPSDFNPMFTIGPNVQDRADRSKDLTTRIQESNSPTKYVQNNFGPPNLESTSYEEVDGNCVYTLRTPVMPNYIQKTDLIVTLTVSNILLAIRGSGSRINRMFQPVLNMETIRNVSLGRDFEMWINLLNPVRSGTIPYVTKEEQDDESWVVKISFPKEALDTPYLGKLHRLYADHKPVLAHANYGAKFPSNPYWTKYSISNSLTERPTEVFTVTDQSSAIVEESRKSFNTPEAARNQTQKVFDIIEADRMLRNATYAESIYNLDELKTSEAQLKDVYKKGTEDLGRTFLGGGDVGSTQVVDETMGRTMEDDTIDVATMDENDEVIKEQQVPIEERDRIAEGAEPGESQEGSSSTPSSIPDNPEGFRQLSDIENDMNGPVPFSGDSFLAPYQ